MRVANDAASHRDIGISRYCISNVERVQEIRMLWLGRLSNCLLILLRGHLILNIRILNQGLTYGCSYRRRLLILMD